MVQLQLRSILLAIAAQLGLTGRLAAQSVAGVQQSSVASDTAGDTVGVLRPGDIIRLKIWREPDLSGDFTIDEHGMTVLPKLGPVRVTDHPPGGLRQWLVSSYAAYLRNPSIDVTLLRRVNVQGAVRTPGLYNADPTVRMADVLALAGGVADEGKTDQVLLIRDGKTRTLKLTDETTLAGTTIRSGDQIVVPRKSWFSRNPWVVGVGVSSALGVIRLLSD
jgi:protein involved in polysaccharide export with SLBB domain